MARQEVSGTHGAADDDLRHRVGPPHADRHLPSINIPVTGVVFSYSGLPPDDMAGHIVTVL
jgi:hypothetical protein